jgi:hypothetical protein
MSKLSVDICNRRLSVLGCTTVVLEVDSAVGRDIFPLFACRLFSQSLLGILSSLFI